MKNRLKYSLEKFLKERGIYDRFIYNIEKAQEPPEIDEIGIEDVYRTINKSKGEDCILIAFIFRRTQEGAGYWVKVAKEFDEIDK